MSLNLNSFIVYKINIFTFFSLYLCICYDLLIYLKRISDFIDLIDEVLKHLKNDSSTLFNCLLLNRIWCARAVLPLYENPFENIVIYKYSNPKNTFNHAENINTNKYSIIWTLILCFNKAELSYLKDRSK